jgi:uncharacterized phage protein gp47/JayE
MTRQSKIMATLSTFHSSCGGFDFLGIRKGRSGGFEIVYDDGVRRRLVWRVQGKAGEAQLGDALRNAVDKPRVLPAMYSELKKRSIAIEAVAV